MENIREWLDREQEHKLTLEWLKQGKNARKNAIKLNKEIARQDIIFVELRNKGIKNLHPIMLKKCADMV